MGLTITPNTSSAAGITNMPQYLMYSSLGGVIKAETIPVESITTSTAPNSQQIYFARVYLNVGATLTGVKWFQQISGVYTASNYNGVGLYTYSGGTLTLVASSTNDGLIWKGSGTSLLSKAFTSSYVAAPGVYFVAFMYSASAVTTLPTFGCQANIGSTGIVIMDFTNTARLYSMLSTQTALPTTQAMSGCASVATVWYLGIY